MNLVSGRFERGTLPDDIRALMRIDDYFLVRKTDFVVGGMKGDFVRTFVWYTMQSANTRHLMRTDATLQYGALYTLPPDEMRQPITVQGLVGSLRLPYETVRRYVLALERDGLCVRVAGKGFYAPANAMLSPQNLEGIKLLLIAMQRFVSDLKRADFDFSDIGGSRRNPPPQDQLSISRAMLRLDTEYSLDTIDLLRGPLGDDLTKSILFRGILVENTLQIPPQEFATLDTMVPDDLRRPVSVLSASNALNMPYETLRRTMNQMERAGLVRRIGKQGFIVPAAVQAAIDTEQTLRTRHVRMRRYLTDLYRIGMAMPA